PDCSIASAGDVEVVVNFSDPSEVFATELNGLMPVEENGSEHTFWLPVSETYTFVAEDVHGYVTTSTYKSDGQRINEIAKVRIGEDMLNEFLPLINEQASGMEAGSVDGSGEPILENIYINIADISHLMADIKYINVGAMDMQHLEIGDSAPYPLIIDMFMSPQGEENVDWVDGNDTVDDTSDVGVHVLMTVQDYTWCTSFFCGFPGFTEAKPCPIEIWDRCNIGKIRMDVRMYIEKMRVNSALGLNVTQGDFDIRLNAHNGQQVITMYDVKGNLDGSESGDSADQGLIDNIIGSSAIAGVIKSLVEDTVNRNLEELAMEKAFEFDTGAEMKISGRIEHLSTDGGGGDNIGNLMVDLSGNFETLTADTTIPPALGSFYVDDEPLPSKADEGASLGVVVNANIVNQALLAMYNTGATHLTLLDGEMHTGLGVTDGLGSENSLRVELNPSSPGEFYLEGESTDQAFLAFRGAEMRVSRKEAGEWSTLMRLNVDIKAGVKMAVIDDFMTLTVAATPEYVINHMDDLEFGGTNLSGFLGREVIEFLVERIIEWGIPLVADTHLKIDVSKLGVSDKLYTESARSHQGHLNFETSVRQ
ncbi:MAG: hypothetical protein OXE99_10900, partial [Cellvibrionales bacterium]|nr:hypothetical protein [Cellvibrionales bacterium]